MTSKLDYATLLTDARKNLPESVTLRERFEIPNVRGHLQGNRTVISNILQIAETLRRDVNHLVKFVLKELAAPGEVKKSGALIMGTKIPASRINDKIRKYADEYVLCKDCGKPDTVIERDASLMFLKCTACGSRNVIRAKI